MFVFLWPLGPQNDVRSSRPHPAFPLLFSPPVHPGHLSISFFVAGRVSACPGEPEPVFSSCASEEVRWRWVQQQQRQQDPQALNNAAELNAVYLRQQQLQPRLGNANWVDDLIAVSA